MTINKKSIFSCKRKTITPNIGRRKTKLFKNPEWESSFQIY